jgi:hypothetical protein
MTTRFACLASIALLFPACAQSPFPPEKVELLGLMGQLDPNDPEVGTDYGHAVAVSGNIVLVGAPFDDDSVLYQPGFNEGTNAGCVFAFVNQGGSWQKAAQWTPSPRRYEDDHLLFGWSIAANRSYAVVGAPHQREYGGLPGYAWVYPINGSIDSLTPYLGVRLSASSGVAPGCQFGYAVAIGQDAGTNTVVVGALHGNGRGSSQGDGAAFVFVHDGTPGAQWAEKQKLFGSQDDWWADFGAAVAMHGTNLVVGAPAFGVAGPNGPGRVYVFERQANGLYAERQILTASDAQDGFNFGASLAIDGANLLVGAGAGRVYVFRRDITGWHEAATRLTPRVNSGDFGSSMAISGQTLVVGAPSGGGGAAHFFTWSGAGWTEEPTRTGQSYGNHPWYGRAVAIGGDSIVVGGTAAGAVFGLDYANDTNVAAYVAKFLYVPEASNSRFFDPWQAAFRYQHFLFGKDTNNILRARYQHLSEYYGPAERARAAAAEAELWVGLAANPASVPLGDLLLDLYYDRTVAESIPVGDALADADLTRFGLRNAVTNEFVIDREADAYDQALSQLQSVLESHFRLLSHPAGCQAFKTRVPVRALMPLTCVETNGLGAITNTFSVTGDSQPLFPAFKDLVLIYHLLGDYGHAAAELARLQLLRGQQSPAQDLIGRAQRTLTLNSALLHALVRRATLPPDDPSGLAQAVAAVNNALETLDQTKQSIRGHVNQLGFEDDFLLFAKVEDGTDSFDVLRTYLDPELWGSQPLASARREFRDLKANYSELRESEDELAEQFSESSITYNDRLRDIVGVFPDDPRYSENPGANPGSELDQQYRSIDLAAVRIQRNRIQIDNLKREVEIEIQRAVAVSNVVIDFGNRRADITETIGHINAAQGACDALASAFSFTSWGATFFGIFNAAAKAGAEEAKGQLEADKERLAALEQATVGGIESGAKVKTLLLNMRTLLIDSQESALEMSQEVHRFEGLIREKHDLERKLAQRNLRLSRRYFADPIHRVRVQASMIRTDHTFAEAQKWLFFMTRALEYKWNKKPWSQVHLGRTWDSSTVFKLRNAGELVDYYEAMLNYDAEAAFSYEPSPLHDWFSVRQDFFGYNLTNRLGEFLLYTDPDTGAQLDGITAFRGQLRKLESNGMLRLVFSTVRECPGGDFFKGPQFDAAGQMWTKGYWLDKIDWLRINLIGRHTLGLSKLTGNLSYGGTSFMRNFRVGNRTNRLDRLQNEMTAYSTRYWYYDIDQRQWVSEGPQSTPLTMQLREDPRLPSSAFENRQFMERSVATTRWELAIPLREGDHQVLDIDELDDIEIEFQHRAVPRP